MCPRRSGEGGDNPRKVHLAELENSDNKGKHSLLRNYSRELFGEGLTGPRTLLAAPHMSPPVLRIARTLVRTTWTPLVLRRSPLV